MHGSALTQPQGLRLGPLIAQNAPWLVVMHRTSPATLEPKEHEPATGTLPVCFCVPDLATCAPSQDLVANGHPQALGTRKTHHSVISPHRGTLTAKMRFYKALLQWRSLCDFSVGLAVLIAS